MRRIVLLLMTVLVVGCAGRERPEGVMGSEAMVSFLEEAYLLEGFYAVETQHRYDTLLPEVLAAYDSILAKHGLTRQDVERSFDYYVQHPQEYQAIQDSVIARLDRGYGAEGEGSEAEDIDMVF